MHPSSLGSRDETRLPANNSCYGISPRGRSNILSGSKLSSGGVDGLQRELPDLHRRHRQLPGTLELIAFGFDHPYGLDQLQVVDTTTHKSGPGMLSLPVNI